MKKKKKIIIWLVVIAFLSGLLNNPSQAVNETNDTKQNTTTVQENQTQTKKESTNTEKTNNTVAEKSSNANLSNLGIRPHDFTGFKYGTTSYEVSVPEDTETVEVYATVQDATAKITGTGNKKLEKGENTVQVVVTAEDGTKKTYTINIIREIQQEKEEKEEEKIENVEPVSNEVDTNKTKGLARLEINNLDLKPEFKTDVYNYTVKYIGEATKLDIEAEATEKGYIIELIGNENLQEGENIITILVSDSNGNNVATYQITVNKSLVDEEAVAKEEAKKREKKQKIIIGAGVAVVALIIGIVAIIMRRRNRNIAEEFSRVGFYEEDVPNALKNENFKEKEDFETMSKDEVKEQFLDSYNVRR